MQKNNAFRTNDVFQKRHKLFLALCHLVNTLYPSKICSYIKDMRLSQGRTGTKISAGQGQNKGAKLMFLTETIHLPIVL